MIPGGWELVVIVVVLLLLFGAKRLPDMARSVGRSARVFKGEMKGLRDDDEGRDVTAAAPAQSPRPPESPRPSVEPAALPPADEQVDRPASGRTTGAGGRPDRPDTDR